MAYCLKQNESVGGGLRRIAHERIADARQALRNADPDTAVHCVRKQIKKLRAIVRLARPADRQWSRTENRRLRDVAQRLGGSRDAAVASTTLEELLHELDASAAGALQPLVRRFAAQRDKLRLDRDRPRDRRRLAEVDAALADAADRIDHDWPIDALTWDELVKGLRRSYRRGRDAFDAAVDSPSPERFHDWRKRVKDLWYQARLLRKARPKKKANRLIDKLDDLADLLGDDHDLAELQRRVIEQGLPARLSAAAAELSAAIQRRRLALQSDAMTLGRDLYRRKPGPFAKRFTP
jgi:CHAD domain-containing protein